ncbi:protein TE10 [Testudinid alphaherpesvirus 3]|uniref:Protein TE10 n=1 Tax=Testudinid alphaherpesvirus 3 TaxID=2560801 RepID=A0A0M3LCR6_9ALPH|nr:protein TE10 [Testudinid alphaherpesvirus 3]AIU39320.1 protein TE10 [Testudinid alphaherpesvirus 3]
MSPIEVYAWPDLVWCDKHEIPIGYDGFLKWTRDFVARYNRKYHYLPDGSCLWTINRMWIRCGSSILTKEELALKYLPYVQKITMLGQILDSEKDGCFIMISEIGEVWAYRDGVGLHRIAGKIPDFFEKGIADFNDGFVKPRHDLSKYTAALRKRLYTQGEPSRSRTMSIMEEFKRRPRSCTEPAIAYFKRPVASRRTIWNQIKGLLRQRA